MKLNFLGSNGWDIDTALEESGVRKSRAEPSGAEQPEGAVRAELQLQE